MTQLRTSVTGNQLFQNRPPKERKQSDTAFSFRPSGYLKMMEELGVRQEKKEGVQSWINARRACAITRITIPIGEEVFVARQRGNPTPVLVKTCEFKDKQHGGEFHLLTREELGGILKRLPNDQKPNPKEKQPKNGSRESPETVRRSRRAGSNRNGK